MYISIPKGGMAKRQYRKGGTRKHRHNLTLTPEVVKAAKIHGSYFDPERTISAMAQDGMILEMQNSPSKEVRKIIRELE